MPLKTLLSNPAEQCLTFLPDDETAYFGYRFLEGEPLLLNNRLEHPSHRSLSWGALPAEILNRAELPRSEEWKPGWLTAYDDPGSAHGPGLSFRALAGGAAWCKVSRPDDQREFYFLPEADGIKVWQRFTAARDIPTSCCIQQCLRFTGQFNAEWRRAVACIPFLSEFDMQAMGNPNGTLTCALRGGRWFAFPLPYTAYPVLAVPPGGPGHGAERIDNGLVARQTVDRKQAPASYFQVVAPGAAWEQLVAGMYWERTVFVSNRHPADCIHAWLDVGPLEAGQARTLHGKIYFFEGSREDLLEHWQRDFQEVE